MLLLLIAGGCAVLADAFNSMYEPKPEFAMVAWVLTGLFGLAGAFLIFGSKAISRTKQPQEDGP